jgi:NO-binding membrane sensor protein with MHYT domain
MSDSPLIGGSVALPTALGTLMIVLAFYVALELSHRVRKLGTSERNPWLMASALALTCGVASAQVLHLSSMLGPVGVGFHPGLLFAAALSALSLNLAAAHWTFVANVGWLRVLAGAGALALAALAGQMLLLNAAGLDARVEWNPAALGLSWLVSAAGFAWALVVFLPH